MDWLVGEGRYIISVEVPPASSFLEAHVSGAKSVMTVGKCHVESVSNVFALVHHLIWKAKWFI